MATHTIEPDSRTLHGFFSPDLAPILTIESGDTVRFRTLDADWGLGPLTEFVPPGPPKRRRATTTVAGPMGHALCGPVAIRGATAWLAGPAGLHAPARLSARPSSHAGLRRSRSRAGSG